MTTWGLVIETTVGAGDRKHLEAYVVAHVIGSRAEALAELERRARSHSPEHPRSPRRRRLLRNADGFLLVIDGVWQSFVTRFSVAELLEDSAAPEPAMEDSAAPEPAMEDSAAPEPMAEAPTVPEPVAEAPTVPVAPPPEPVTEDVDRYADGVPVKPAWLGRSDLP